MNPPATLEAPARRVPEPAPTEDLDQRIRRAEQDLIARDERVRRQVRALGQRLHRARESQRWVLPAAGATAGLLALWWLRRRARAAWQRLDDDDGVPRRGARDAQAPPGRRTRHGHHGHRGEGGRGGLVTIALQLLPVVWPVLPVAWRRRFSPASTGTLAGIGVGLLQRLLAARTLPPLRTVPWLDLRRYAGTWHEIARLPEPHEEACRDQPRATYTPRGKVIDVLNRCRGADGRERLARGIARVVPGSGGARLQVNFAPPWLHWLPMTWADYCVLYIDADYSVALVGVPSRQALWVLAREPRLAPAALRAVVEVARVQGFPVERLQHSQA